MLSVVLCSKSSSFAADITIIQDLTSFFNMTETSSFANTGQIFYTTARGAKEPTGLLVDHERTFATVGHSEFRKFDVFEGTEAWQLLDKHQNTNDPVKYHVPCVMTGVWVPYEVSATRRALKFSYSQAVLDPSQYVDLAEHHVKLSSIHYLPIVAGYRTVLSSLKDFIHGLRDEYFGPVERNDPSEKNYRPNECIFVHPVVRDGHYSVGLCHMFVHAELARGSPKEVHDDLRKLVAKHESNVDHDTDFIDKYNWVFPMAITDERPRQFPIGFPSVLLYDSTTARPSEHAATRRDSSYALTYNRMIVRCPVFSSSQAGIHGFVPKELVAGASQYTSIRLREPLPLATPDVVREGKKAFVLDTLQCPSLAKRIFNSTLAWVQAKARRAQRERDEAAKRDENRIREQMEKEQEDRKSVV